MSKVCIKCGAELEDNALFCDDCGEKQPVQNIVQHPQAVTSGAVENVMKQSGFGIASLVLGIISIITLGVLYIPEILGIVFGIIGVCDKTKKRSFALAGLIMSGIITLFMLVIIVIAILTV